MRGGNCMTCDSHYPLPIESTPAARGREGEAAQSRRRIGRRARSDARTANQCPDRPDDHRALPGETGAAQRSPSAQFDRSRRLNALKDRLKDNDAAAIRSLGDQQDRLDGVIDSYEQQLKTFPPRLADIATKQQRLARSLDRLPGTSPHSRSNQRSLPTSGPPQQYHRAVSGANPRRSADNRQQHVYSPSPGSRGLPRGPYRRDYRVELLGQHGQPIETSEGGKQLVALSLIGALKQAAVRGGPVVLDSPLARLDLEHRANVLQTWVPSLGNQAVLLVQSGELTESDARDILGSRIGQEYRIYRPNNDPDEAQIERTQ